jgi:amino acid adenylation domain-containing protein
VSAGGLNPTGRFVPFLREDVEQSIPERFEKQVARYPHHVAVKTRNKQLTYTNLNQAANQLAQAILGGHLQENEPVAILLEQDTSAIVAIFGVLKAAKGFIPLDPSLPPTRLRYMLDDSGATRIVTDNYCLRLAQDLLDHFRTVINLDELDVVSATGNLRVPICPDHMSCILYTSGTTGKPKGVVHTHRNELHNVMHHTNSLFLSADDRLTLLGSYSTGQGMQDLYSALLNGGTLYPWSFKTAGLTGLADWLIQERITVYHSAATVYRHVIKQFGDGCRFSDLRIIRLGSEPVSWKDFELYKKYFADHCVFVNALSSSETKTIRQCVLTKDTDVTGMIPVGHAVPDMDVLVLDAAGNELGFNQSGEIAVRSRYLSTGYWRNPELTQAVFQLDPSDIDRRIFRTGEWGQMSADGCLAHFGRRDDRVKIRGYRIEIHEVELALLQHSAVDQALILCRDGYRGDKYLVAYIVLARFSAPTVSDLRLFLQQRIPDYMIPSVFVFLESLPLTPNGKVDRGALPEPSKARPALGAEFVAPRDPTEEVLTKLWGEILGIDDIGVLDNHFDLGGNSLTAMQVCAHVEKQFQVILSLRQFFESPTIASLSRAISAASRSAGTVSSLPLKPFPRDTDLPLSFAQQRLWFLDQWAPGQSVYNVCEAYRVKGRLDENAIEESLNELVRRHEILRTTFSPFNDQPIQVIAASLRLKLIVKDLSALPEGERDDRSLAVASGEARCPFDLVRGPLLRATLVRLAADEQLLLFTLHQIVCDGWSMKIFLREFWTFYRDFWEQRLPSLAALSVQYGDFTLWQHQRLQEGTLEPQVLFWKRQLGENLPVLNLPTDRPRPPLETFQGRKVFFVLAQTLTDGLNDLSRQEGVTLFMLLLAAFKILIYRHTDQEDLAVGFPVANRNWTETDKVIGLFVNTLVARTHPLGSEPFRAFLIKVKEVCIGAYAHQDVPFEKLVEIMRPSRDLSRNPLFQTMFTFQNMTVADAVPQELRLTPVGIDNGTSKVDITLSLTERDHQLAGFFEYSTDLFHPDTAERMTDRFRRLLEGIVNDRHQTLAELPLLSEHERRRLLVEWNDTTVNYPKDGSIKNLFERQAALNPDTVALEFEGHVIIYRELNRKANQLAHYLVRLGIGPEKLVGICVERSIEMVVGLLGILKAGGAYVPLDPTYPKERLRFMVEDAELSVLLTTEKLIAERQEAGDGDTPFSALDPRLEVVCLDRNAPEIEQQSTFNLNIRIGAELLAYVIYTSGSTGAPKGVCGLHRGAVNRFSWMWQVYPFQENERSCIKTSLSFVDSVWEIFGPLVKGVPSVLISDETLRDPQLLVRVLAESDVTRIVVVPSLLKTLLEMFPDLQERLPQLRFWCSSGERLPQELAQQFRQSMPDAVLLNLYGSTEVSGDATCYDVRFADLDRDIPIGRPISNTQAYILDAQRQPMPTGVFGELWVGGDGLARGYWKRPELTAERFVRNPFSAEPESRLYRTGDRARYRPDGNIEFLGRTDNQVKIRGYRIELGEIEAILNQHSSVRECVVVARARESSEGTELIAYIVSTQELLVSVDELRRFLRGKLPEYMIPSGFVFLDALPLNPNGKIDRDALPSHDLGRPWLEEGFLEPRTGIEELVAQVWREVLKLDKIGVHDNFFDLGGHSLVATRIVARLRNIFAVDLLLRKLFELPTVATLAQHIDDLLHRQSDTVTPPIVPVNRDRLIPASFSQQRLWFLHELDPKSTAYNISSVFSVRGPLDVPALEEALNALIARHEILRTTFSVVEGTPVQNILPTLSLTLPVTNLTELPVETRETEAGRIALEEARRPFDLRSGPLLRELLLSLGDEHYVFLLNFDHTILDGWSMGILFKELGSLYDAFANRKPLALPLLAVQYADFTVWQREHLQGDAFEVQLEYWKRQLGNDLPTVNFPADYARSAPQSSRGIRKSHGLTKPLTDSIKGLSRREGVTIFMTLLATLKILLHRYSSQADVIVGSTVAGRTHPEIEGLIGFFVNALPLRTDLSGQPSFLDLLKRVRKVCLGAYTHQDMPFEKIVETINPNRDLSRNPLFQIMFNMADVSERVLQLAGCEVRKESFFDPEAKFDITLYAPEQYGALELTIVYNADLFVESRITSLLDQFAHLLAQIAENPQGSIGEYSLVSPSTRALLPNPTEALEDRWEGAIHELCSEKARIMPEKPAVLDSDDILTYRELDLRSTQLANCLTANGIRPKDIVAIYAHRSASLVVALLGILRAGGVFVILDPAYPSARLLAYLSIAQPKGWVQMDDAGELPADLANGVQNLSCQLRLPTGKHALADLLGQQPEVETRVAIRANDPAYIAFTSGSTGEPKGVVGRHGPITHFLPWQTETFDLGASDHFCLLSGLAYNHLHRDVFTPLALGATLYVPPADIVREPAQLVEWLRENSISVLHLTPALGQLLLTAGPQPLPAVRRVFFGGDVLTRGEVARIRELAPNATIGSFYGATETQRAVGYYEISFDFASKDTEANRPIPLGRGIKDVQLLLLNKAGQLAGVGELAELYVRSPHLAERYIADEKLTAERFVTNPFTNDPDDRLYRTGELGRYLPDGNVEWAGRNDRRVNIRGFRVELAEVESVIKQHPAVADAAVVLQDYEIPSPENLKPETQNTKPDQRLVAYVVPELDQPLSLDGLRSFLSARLPDYMVPSHFLILGRLPLTPNGKVDYEALPPADDLPGVSEGSSRSPQTALERTLGEIFAQVLGLEQVGVNDNFFRHGGHSLLAAQVAARVRETFGVALDLRSFVETPTVASLARQVALLLQTRQAAGDVQDKEREEIEL